MAAVTSYISHLAPPLTPNSSIRLAEHYVSFPLPRDLVPTAPYQHHRCMSFTLPSRSPKSMAVRTRMETVCRNMVKPQKNLILRSACCPSCAVFISLLSPSPTLSRSFPLTHQHTHNLPRSPSLTVFTVVASHVCREMHNSLPINTLRYATRKVQEHRPILLGNPERKSSR